MYLKAGDTLSGAEGKAQMNIEGSIEELAQVKNVEATLEKKKEEVKVLGNRGTQHKTTGWSGKGKMSMYYITSLFRKKSIQYVKSGKDFYFDLVITNDDPSSSVGKQTIVLYNCNLDSVVLAKLDVESKVLEEEFDFTFDDVDILDEFNKPII